MAPSGSARRRGANAFSKIVTRIGVSVLLGVIAFALSYELDVASKGPLVVGLGASVFVTGVAFVAQFLIEVETRIDIVGDAVAQAVTTTVAAVERVERRSVEHNRETEQMIRDEFKKINEATELFGAVEASALNTDAMTQLVRNSTTVVQATGSLVSDFAQAEIARLSGYLRDLGQGADVTYDGEDRDWLLGLTKVARATIDATSLTTVDAGGRSFVDGGLWTSGFGQQYLDAQREAIERGAVIRRIFIFDRPELQQDKDVVNILQEHAAIGVTVRTLNPADTPRSLSHTLFDFVVIDSVLSYQATTASRIDESRPVINTTTLITNPDRVRERIGRYKDLWTSGTDFTAPNTVPTQRTSP